MTQLPFKGICIKTVKTAVQNHSNCYYWTVKISSTILYKVFYWYKCSSEMCFSINRGAVAVQSFNMNDVDDYLLYAVQINYSFHIWTVRDERSY